MSTSIENRPQQLKMKSYGIGTKHSTTVQPYLKLVAVTLVIILLSASFVIATSPVVTISEPSHEFELDYEEMFENHGAIMLIIETDTGRILQANEAAVAFYGYPEDVIESMAIQEINQLTPEETEAERKKAAAEERNFFVFRHKLANGEIRTVEVYSWPYSPDQRQLLFSIIKDITPEVAAVDLVQQKTFWLYISISITFVLLLAGLSLLDKKRRNLAKSLQQNKIVHRELVKVKEKYRSILDDIPALICEFLPDSTLTYVNKGYCDYFDLPQEELVGKPFLELIPEDQHEAVQKKFLSLNQERPMEYYDQYTVHGDTIKWQEWRDIAIFDPQGQAERYYSVGIDVTERKALMNQLEQEKDKAQAANKAKTQFLTNMSHELRTPLNGLGGMLQLLQLTDLDEEQQELTSGALESATALTSVISNILNYSKLDRNEMAPLQKPLNLEKLMSRCMKVFISKARLKGLNLNFYFDDTIKHLVVGDPLMLQETLIHLIGNAVKFTHAGHVTLSVSRVTGSDSSHERLKFEVEDSGIGIPAEQIDQIFDWFKQGDDSTTKTYAGIGIGLTLAKRMVELMDGELKGESEHGKGTRFWFEIEHQPTGHEQL